MCFLLAVAVFITGASLSDSLPSDFTVSGEKGLSLPDDIPISAGHRDISNSVFDSNSKKQKYSLNLFGLFPIKDVSVNFTERPTVCLSGKPFGIKIFTDGVMIVGITDIKTETQNENPAKKAGLKVGDIVLSANGQSLNSNSQFKQILSAGEKVSLKCKRGSEEFETQLEPVVSVEDGVYKAGLWVRDSSAGIGTMTFINAQNQTFAGLGHSVCDVDTGQQLTVQSGEALPADIIGITKGKKGAAGELQGCFVNSGRLGEILLNTDCGVFGEYELTVEEFESVEVAMRQEIKKGDAKILSYVSGEAEFYDCKIQRIDLKSSSRQNMVIKITDQRLIELTGGIVQGMSGSPIIQEGRLAGAVTHVFVDDPTCGYGVFAESMLECSKSAGELCGQQKNAS